MLYFSLVCNPKVVLRFLIEIALPVVLTFLTYKLLMSFRVKHSAGMEWLAHTTQKCCFNPCPYSNFDIQVSMKQVFTANAVKCYAEIKETSKSVLAWCMSSN